MKARTFVMVFGGIELLFGLLGSGGVAHFAHLGGMLGAWLMINWWRGKRGNSSRQAVQAMTPVIHAGYAVSHTAATTRITTAT